MSRVRRLAVTTVLLVIGTVLSGPPASATMVPAGSSCVFRSPGFDYVPDYVYGSGYEVGSLQTFRVAQNWSWNLAVKPDGTLFFPNPPDFAMDWGDGTVEPIPYESCQDSGGSAFRNWRAGDFTHRYAKAGAYDVRLLDQAGGTARHLIGMNIVGKPGDLTVVSDPFEAKGMLTGQVSTSTGPCTANPGLTVGSASDLWLELTVENSGATATPSGVATATGMLSPHGTAHYDGCFTAGGDAVRVGYDALSDAAISYDAIEPILALFGPSWSGVHQDADLLAAMLRKAPREVRDAQQCLGADLNGAMDDATATLCVQKSLFSLFTRPGALDELAGPLSMLNDLYGVQQVRQLGEALTRLPADLMATLVSAISQGANVASLISITGGAQSRSTRARDRAERGVSRADAHVDEAYEAVVATGQAQAQAQNGLDSATATLAARTQAEVVAQAQRDVDLQVVQRLSALFRKLGCTLSSCISLGQELQQAKVAAQKSRTAFILATKATREATMNARAAQSVLSRAISFATAAGKDSEAALAALSGAKAVLTAAEEALARLKTLGDVLTRFTVLWNQAQILAAEFAVIKTGRARGNLWFIGCEPGQSSSNACPATPPDPAAPSSSPEAARPASSRRAGVPPAFMVPSACTPCSLAAW